MYDVAIVGGSFAGLATAMQLRGYQVLLIEQYPIGTHQMSACGTPLATARAVGAECAIQDSHDALVLHTDGREIRFPLPDPYATFDYQAFCQAMLAQTNAEVWQARATGFVAGGVATTRGTVQARFIVDATGWRALHSRGADPAPGPLHVGYGLETELPIRLDLSPGLHFYVEKHIMRSGYGWVFPCRATTRFGIGAFEQGGQLGRLLDQFLARFGLCAGPTHGGVLAIGRRAPLAGEVFVVGDAAGQCLPASGEGIRTAIFHGIHCGRAIAAALRGAISADEARALYREQARGADGFHGRLLKLQALVAAMPDPLLAAVGRICSQPALTHHIMRKYLIDSGWFLGVSLPSCLIRKRFCVMRDKILVIGGYGHVGCVISTMLGEQFPGLVLAAGRDFSKAAALAHETGHRVNPVQFDLRSGPDAELLLSDVRLVVMCLDQGEVGFVRACIGRGIHYIDISASYAFLSQVERLDTYARERGATGVLSVGLAPGLTNLLAKRCKDVFDELQRVDIAIMLGLGEAHGKAAIQWTVDNIDARFAVPRAEGPKRVSSFADPKPARFPGGYGWRKTYRFNFADQHVVARTLNIDRVSTRLCFDSAVVTHLLALCSKAHLFRMLRIAGAQRPLAALISRLHVGSDVFAVKVDAEGMIKNEPYAYACSISGRREGYVTGVVAALVAERVYTSSFRSGIFHIEQLFDPLALFAQIADRGFAVDLGLPQRVGRATETSQKKGDRHSPPR